MRCPTLKDLPRISSETGWPWTEESTQLSDFMQDGKPWPRISIVTPSYNQGQFLEETIRSVLLQGYPDLEYIIIDGGSTDNSIEIIRKYEPWLSYWISEKDRGQSHAINKGWSRATGLLIGYLNSDDTFLPNALQKIVTTWNANREAAAVVGAVVMTDELSRRRETPGIPFLPAPAPIDLTIIDYETWFLPQQSGFFSCAALDKIGRFVMEDLSYTLDRELYYRICLHNSIILINDAVATYRHHQNSKTLSKTIDFYNEDPKAIMLNSNHTDGNDNLRKKIGRWRMAQGHFKYAKSAPDSLMKIIHLFKALTLRPGYMKRMGFYIVFLDAIRLKGPLKWLRNRITKRGCIQ